MTDTNTPDTRDTGDAPADAVTAERDDFKDRLLRMTAEFDNYRKRIDRERRELSEAAAVDLIRDLLPVLDDLERAMAAAGNGPDNPLLAGVTLTHKQLLEQLRRRGVEPVVSVGELFNPEWHEAVTSEPAEGRRDGEILADFRRGYRIGGRLLRPAMVKVAKA